MQPACPVGAMHRQGLTGTEASYRIGHWNTQTRSANGFCLGLANVEVFPAHAKRCSMGRKFHARYNKNFFDPHLAILGGGQSNKYVDAFHRDAARKIELRHLTERIRAPVNMAGVQAIPKDSVIYGIANTDICKLVTLETLTTRMGVAKAIYKFTQQPTTRKSFKQMMRARKFTDMHEPILQCANGPFELQ